MTISIRPLGDPDLESADAVLKLAFQSPVSRFGDLCLYRQIQPDGWFAATQSDHLVGMVGAAKYDTFAHVGLMAVHPQTQRQGVGSALMQYLLSGLERQQVPLVTLDASQAGRPLYEKLGFISYDETLVFQRHVNGNRPERPAHIQVLTGRELDELVELDTAIFGADRRKVFQVLLKAFPERAFIQRDSNGQLIGYLFAQKNRIGPWVTLQPGFAEALLLAALGLPYEETVSVTVPSVNPDAIELLWRHGFDWLRANRHMGRGKGRLPGNRQKIYSQTSLAVG